MKHKIFIFLSILFIFTLFFGSISVNASITNLIIDNKEMLINTIDEKIDSAFDDGEQELEVIITGPFVSNFHAADNSFLPEESYFTSTDPIHKYRYTAGNDYKGLTMDKVNTHVSFSYNKNSTEITNFDVVYKVSSWLENPAESNYVNNFVKNKLSEVLADAQTEYEKVKNIHDYIIKNYDFAYSDTYNSKSASAYGMITNGRGVSSAYTLLFDAFCRAANLETRIVFSDESYVITDNSFFNHSWNMVVVNGRWYHVDVTWDDQPHLKNGIVYNYFLKSSDYFLKNFHLWDDRPSDGSCGTPYPISTKNYYDAPGGYDGDSITRPIKGDMPKILEKKIGLQSSVPEVVELSSIEDVSSDSSDTSEESEIHNNGFISNNKYFIISAVIMIVLIIIIVLIILKKKKPNKFIEVKESIDNNSVSNNNDNSFDDYDGFDL